MASHTGTYNTKTFEILENFGHLLIHYEEGPTAVGFTGHTMSLKFPIISGEQPMSHLPKLYFLRNVSSAEKGIKIHILFPFRLSWLINNYT